MKSIIVLCCCVVVLFCCCGFDVYSHSEVFIISHPGAALLREAVTVNNMITRLVRAEGFLSL